MSATGGMAGITVLSRVSGLVRDWVVVHLLGAGVVADAFYTGFRIPNMFRQLLAEGALQAAFVPTLAELKASGDLPRARAVRFIAVEDDAGRIGRPGESRDLEPAARDLGSRAAISGDDVQVIPSVAIADERDPLPVGRRDRFRTEVREAPEFRILVPVDASLRSASSIGNDDLARAEVWRHPLDNEALCIDPARSLFATG